MKKMLVFGCFIIAAMYGNAQQQFEGTIVYRLHASMDEKKNNPDAELTAQFAPHRIKLMFNKDEKNDPEVILINLDSGKVYTMNYETKKYSEKMLQEKPAFVPVGRRTYLGYNTTAVQPGENGISPLLGGLFGSSEVTLFSSDSLLFNVPEKYSKNTELVIVNKNHIVLGAEIKLGTLMEASDDTAKKENIITAAAKEITPMTFNPATFEIPAGFISRNNDIVEPDSVTTMVDTTAAMIDTIPPQHKRSPVKKSIPKKTVPKKPASNKSSASMRKP